MDDSWTINLSPEDNDGSGFRLQNTRKEVMRRSVISRPGALSTQARVVQVTHGMVNGEGSSLATLIVVEVMFLSSSITRRFKSVAITFRFATMGQGNQDPEVLRIAPEGAFLCIPTKQAPDLPTDTSLGPSVAVGPERSDGLTNKWQLVEGRSTGQVELVGLRRIQGRNYGNKNAAYWSLTEDVNEKRGVPTALRMAMLLEREDEFPFAATIDVHATTDVLSSISTLGRARLFGKIKEEIIFEPDRAVEMNLESAIKQIKVGPIEDQDRHI